MEVLMVVVFNHNKLQLHAYLVLTSPLRASRTVISKIAGLRTMCWLSVKYKSEHILRKLIGALTEPRPHNLIVSKFSYMYPT